MGSEDDSPAAVRIELSTGDDLTNHAPLATEASHARGKVVLALLAAALLVAGLLSLTRPDDGETAAGTPITAPTTTDVDEAPATSSDQGTGDEVIDEAGDEGSATDTIAEPPQFETADFDTFMFSVVSADIGWLGLGFSGDATGLWRSVDGLDWTALPDDALPPGDLLGFDRIDGVYLIAMDELRSWTEGGFNFENGESPRHRITVWQSSDAVNWFPTERPVLEGTGFPYPASFSRDAYVVPMVEPSTSHDAVIAFLEPFVDATVAGEVCAMRRASTEAEVAVVLEDCDGEIIAEVSEADFPDDFVRLTRDYCLEVALSIDAQRALSVVVENDAPTQRIELDDGFALFSRALPGGFIAPTGVSVADNLPLDCGGEVEGDSQTNGVVYWTEETGHIDVTPPLDSGSINFGSNFSSPQGRLSLIPGDDSARVRVINGDGIWESEPPFESWNRLVPPPPVAAELLGGATMSLSRDGSAAVVQTRERLHLWAGGEWTAIEFNELEGVELLVSNEEMVIVSGRSRRGARLMRVWLQS